MTIINLHGSKGGVGTSTLATLFALHLAKDASTLLIDPSGDCRRACGVTADESITMRYIQPNLNVVDHHDATWQLKPHFIHTVIDRGVGDGDLPCQGLNWWVLTNTYASLQRFISSDVWADGVVVVVDHRNALVRADVEATIGFKTPMIFIDHDPSFTRACDAGVLSARRPPATFTDTLTSLIEAVA